MTEEILFRTATADEMISAGRQFAATLREGDLVALSGELGAGKTHFSKGLVAGLGCDDDVTSPTFALVQEYLSGPVPVFHFDFYRIESAAELISLGWDDYLEERGIVIAEWAEKFPELLPSETTRIRLQREDDGTHTVIKS